ncbi:adenylate/guanylate cyclase domain-containing protein [Ensifer adhaerens]|uniref:adenylate/guanylate cyclase domain-containing protein n=1 Tax=Ensifer adhaerens TaxID=106592 RepID=UPI00098EE0C0|nr:adenylate/guanylate cyclase domain-containing protein [Ensifer adhaerens]
MLLKVEPPDGWSSQDGRVLFDAEREAERFAANARLAFSLAIAALMLVLSIVIGRWNDWVAMIAIANVAISALSAFLARASVFPRILPWLGVCADALLLFGIGWFGPWLENLPAGMRSALVSPWGAFLLLAVTSLGLNAWRLLVQTVLLGLAISLLIWWPSSANEAGFAIDPRLQLLFSDGSNVTRLAIVLLTGLAMALAASRARKTLMLAIRTARERAVLERFNSAEINRYVLSSNVDTLRNGIRQRVCVLFADIRGFTTLSETLDPSEVVTLLNAFRTRAEQAITAHGGVIDKFIGDGLLAIFGLPSPAPGDAGNAIKAATALAATIDTWSLERQANGEQPVEVGIGVHVGEVFVGLLGDQRYEFTVIGDAVNVGQRLQAESRHLNASVVVSATAFDDAKIGGPGADRWSRHEGLRLRGRSETIDAYAYR